MDEPIWSHCALELDSHRFGDRLCEFRKQIRYSADTGLIREHFAKEILFDLDQIDDKNHRMNDAMRRAIASVLYSNFDGARADYRIEFPLETDHERWESDLRKLFAAIFLFIECPSDDNHENMINADPQG